jgi:acetolactate synthase-1/2/3 large subunit
MKTSGGKAVVRALEDEGIPFTCGIPGTHNIELYDALGESERIRPVLVTDEQSASFMADAVWRSSGQLGCVNVVPGAGLTHALSGIAEAYLDNVAMLVLGCGIRRDTGHAYQLHDIDQMTLVKPVTKAQLSVEHGSDLYATVRRACAIARDGAPGPVFVEVPANLYLVPHSDAGADPAAWAPLAAPRADATGVERAAEILARAKRPLLYLGNGGAGVDGATWVRLAETLESPVSTTLQGKGVFPESHPLWLWPGFGQAAPPFVRKLADGCDATLAVGCRFSEVGTGSYGIDPPGPLIHVDIDASVLGRNFGAEVAIAADAGEFVRALLDRLEPAGRDEALREEIARGHAGLASRLDAGDRRRVSPGRLLPALQQAFEPEAIFTADSGNGTFLAVEHLRLDRPGRFLAPVDYSCMGYSVPAAIGAALANPGTKTIALAGDGAFLMTGLELLTAAHEGLPVLTLVLRDRELAQIAQFQDVALNRKVGSRLPDFDVARICEAIGVECLQLGGDGEIDGVLRTADAALTEGRPIAVDVAIDYSSKTHFTRGVVKTNFLRLAWRDRLRMISRALARRVKG